MYIPSHFEVQDVEALHRLIREHPFGMLVTHGTNGLDANHLPFELDLSAGTNGTLRAHVARANPVWQHAGNGDEVMVVFRAEDGYITPTWYPSKHESHKQVPTWNYRVVHAHGRITIRDEERYVRGVVARLTRAHEASQPAPWKMTDAPADYIDTMLKAIVGIEIDITRLIGKFKLSQNRELRDKLGAAEALKQQGDATLGQAMLDAIAERRDDDGR
ncbi:FMN-binding negative transcriptional regulator [Cupriavidus gilardii]|uniref:FMN-binding negative transcriptional regulator n=1 Tax=Cupriavidus gilardii TaxID=82541 RepID=A0A849B614_9BURK|nr:FMN-binding negative transcriptional regulator [Cupriavidus gilardii]ALD93166.1 Negative transcriptional regulator [Cupriavidus gilardii CR3]KAB0599425.1 FMN-binding negative transcriptional regulator [Cupriavidus gilardii]MCT9013079.1 FMN-binding negative transcriptional regulator [Cupriavidus gilardii]MCT9052633.1 FMN-binding negative transcriptional regulator [Cupriavidus gilardii]MCT9115608.1 FMN-binding negative transcriptional regulator [Cupriavidus gilardii]